MVGGTLLRSGMSPGKGHARDCVNFNEWASFPQLDTFDSQRLISALTAKDRQGPFLWSDDMQDHGHTSALPVIVLQQAEAIFNLSQLMFALYHGSVSACTFRDLQLNHSPRDIRKNGFSKLGTSNQYCGTTFRQALHVLCWDIVENGGLPVIFSMIKHPKLPIIRQKCLDALTNVLCVDAIEKIILIRQPWFVRMLVSMVANGDLQCDMVPAVSVLDRLVVVVLAEKIKEPYDQLMRLKFVQVCLARLQCPTFSRPNLHLHFVKFQTIAMQAVALLCANEQSSTWPEEVQDSIFQYFFHSILLWDTNKPPSDPVWHQSESFYRSMSFSSSALLFSFTVLVHAVLKWPKKCEFLKKKALAFKYQLSKILTLHGSNMGMSIDANTPIIMNAVEWLWFTLYNDETKNIDTSKLCPSILDPLPELCEKVLRYCSNEGCKRRESTASEWKPCPDCGITCYCSNECLVAHQQVGHQALRCQYLSMRSLQQVPVQASESSDAMSVTSNV